MSPPARLKIKLPDNKPEVTELTAKTLIEGEGAEVKETDTVYVRYIWRAVLRR